MKPLERWAVVAVVAVLAVVACRRGSPPAAGGPEQLPEGADQVLIGVEHYMTREGLRRARMLADTAYLVNDGTTVELRDVKVDFFDTSGGAESSLTAKRGTYNVQSGDMEADGDVVVVRSNGGEELETERLMYDATADKLRSDVSFVFRERDRITRGSSFVSDPSLNDREIEGFSSATRVKE